MVQELINLRVSLNIKDNNNDNPYSFGIKLKKITLKISKFLFKALNYGYEDIAHLILGSMSLTTTLVISTTPFVSTTLHKNICTRNK